jgi:hypothetical protein
MDNLPDWATSIIAIAVGLSSGILLLTARPIGRFLRRALLERPERALQSRRDPLREGRAAVAAPPGGRGLYPSGLTGHPAAKRARAAALQSGSVSKKGGSLLRKAGSNKSSSAFLRAAAASVSVV